MQKTIMNDMLIQALMSGFMILHVTFACTTLVAGRATTSDGSVMTAHSNDGDGNTAGNLEIVPNNNWTNGTLRHVSRGSIPQEFI